MMRRSLPPGLLHRHDDVRAVPRTLTQYAPWPTALEVAVGEFRYLEGWRFWLSDEPRDFADAARTVAIAGGLTFNIYVPCHDSYHPTQFRPVHHSHPVPAATFNRAAWERWMFDRLMDSVRHEAAEWARFDERRPFAPTHGPGDDPYVLHEYATEQQYRTSYRGEVKEGSAPDIESDPTWMD